MFESLVLIEEKNVDTETLRSVSLMNAMQVVIGNVPGGGGVILHVAANSADDLGKALLEFAQVPGVKGVLTLTIRAT